MAAKKKSPPPFPPRPLLQVYVGKKGRRGYVVEIHGKDYDVDKLRSLFAVIEAHADQHEDLLVTFPVVREMEDPKLMKRLDKACADIKSGKVKTIPWSEVKAQLKKK